MTIAPLAPGAAARAAPEAIVRTRYRPQHPLDLRATLGMLGRGPHDPTTRWDAAGVWRTFRSPQGPVALRLEQRRDGVDAVAVGQGAEWAIDAVPALLGALDDTEPLDDRNHPVLRRAIRSNPGLRLARTGRLLESLVPAIIEQRVTSLEAFRAWARLVRRFGDPAPGAAEVPRRGDPAPGTAEAPRRGAKPVRRVPRVAGLTVPQELRVVPAASTLRAIPSWQWHALGIDPQRGRTVLAACRVADALERMSGAEVTGVEVTGADARRRLQSIRGIGVWTAAEAVQRSHGDPDAVSVGDYNLCTYVGHALVGHAVDDDGMLDLLEPWRGRRQHVVRMLLAARVRVERHGPRATVQDHRYH